MCVCVCTIGMVFQTFHFIQSRRRLQIALYGSQSVVKYPGGTERNYAFNTNRMCYAGGSTHTENTHKRKEKHTRDTHIKGIGRHLERDHDDDSTTAVLVC